MCVNKFVMSLISLLLIWSFANANINVQDRRIRETLQLDDHRKVNDVDRRIDSQRTFESRSQNFDKIRDISSRNLERRSNNEYERRSTEFERRVDGQRSDLSQRIDGRQETNRLIGRTDRRDERRFDMNERQLSADRRGYENSDQTRRTRETNDLQKRNLNSVENERNEKRQMTDRRISDNRENRVENIRSEHRTTREDDTRLIRTDNRLISEENRLRLVLSNDRRISDYREGESESRAIDRRLEQNRNIEVRARTLDEDRRLNERVDKFSNYKSELLSFNVYENPSSFSNYLALSLISLFTIITLKPNKASNSYPTFFKFISI